MKGARFWISPPSSESTDLTQSASSESQRLHSVATGLVGKAGIQLSNLIPCQPDRAGLERLVGRVLAE